jgi:protein ImuB
MAKRYLAIWLRFLKTDWFTTRKPELAGQPFILSAPDHGRMLISAANLQALAKGMEPGMPVADARAIWPDIVVMDDLPLMAEKLLKKIAEWCIRFSPCVAIDEPDGLILDITGCAHLWGGESEYLAEINRRLKDRGYFARSAIAGTIGAAWAVSRFGKSSFVIEEGKDLEAIMHLPPAGLRLTPEVLDRMQKLGLRQIGDFITMPRSALRRRFGEEMVKRLHQALGQYTEIPLPVQPAEPWQERLPCLEPISTATGISIALERLLDSLCENLRREELGLRQAVFKCYRLDGAIVQAEIGTSRPSHNCKHLFKLFEVKIPDLQPDLGIELFTLDAPKVESLAPSQEAIWGRGSEDSAQQIAELVDRISGKLGELNIRRYLPVEHHWPERSIKAAQDLNEITEVKWNLDRPRPTQLLPQPMRIEVTAPIPDYPPMLFRYKGNLHKVIKADGPERIEQEWWIQEGQHRDYYTVEDEEGRRYWIFRSGHYSADRNYQWFIHGYFS